MYSVNNTAHDQSRHEANDKHKRDEINTTRIEIPLHRTDQWSWLLTLVWQKVPNSEWLRNNTVKSVMNPRPLDNKSGYTEHSVILSLSAFSIVLLSSKLHFPIAFYPLPTIPLERSSSLSFQTTSCCWSSLPYWIGFLRKFDAIVFKEQPLSSTNFIWCLKPKKLCLSHATVKLQSWNSHGTVVPQSCYIQASSAFFWHHYNSNRPFYQ